MEENDRKTIQRNLITLSKNVNISRLYPLLIEEGLIRRDDVESLQKRFPGAEDQALEFYLWYTKRGPTAFEALVKSLKTLGYVTEAELLESGSSNGANGAVGTRVAHGSQRGSVEKLPEFVDIRSATPPLPPPEEAQLNGEFQYLDIHVIHAKDMYNGLTYKGPDEYYRMQSKPRGFALIVNNINFKNQAFPYRKGAEVDSVNLKKLLLQLGFEVIVRHDLDRAEFFRELDLFKEKFASMNVDACIVSVMSHGHESIIEMCDHVSATVDIWDDVITRFNNRYCRALRDKPKIFLIQTCRGDLYDYGVPRTEADGRAIYGSETNAAGRSLERRKSSIQVPPKIAFMPEFKDILLCYATIPGYVANREITTGTWYTRTICEIFMAYAHDTEIKKLLDKVGRKMEEIFSEKGNVQTPCYMSIGFNRDLYFNPGLFEDNTRLPP